MIKIQLSDYSMYVYSSFANRIFPGIKRECFYTQNGKENKREIIKTRGYHRPINEVVI